MIRLIGVLIGYLFGCFQTAYIVGELKQKIDIREYGSGNLGTTNAIRVLGWKFGAITFIGDFTKAIAAVLLASLLFDDPIVGFYAGLGAIMGHNWPVFLKFKGGKGIASTLGVAMAVNPIIGLILMSIMAITIYISRFVSLGAIIMVITFPILTFVFHGDQIEYILLALFLMAFALFRHRANIKRLLSGTESKIGHKKNIVVEETTAEDENIK
ncbi:MAG: acyl-phosphate glycerol 3-phosphate acyltransferase [Firmicutes bacterium HGW-Firmicutes-1]|jgi:glycerol-3-phosphate acyltransferase PlsY|nr:MAG: acyl-phosphate glycerol 3-phosphate acyltransferase [Firmicutes bacterium HGW-Firmicutes-1]